MGSISLLYCIGEMSKYQFLLLLLLFEVSMYDIGTAVKSVEYCRLSPIGGRTVADFQQCQQIGVTQHFTTVQ